MCLQDTQAKNSEESHFLIRRHLQLVQRPHGQQKHHHIGDQVDDRGGRERSDLVTALATRNRFIPIKRKRPACEAYRKNSRNSPSENNGRGHIRAPYNPGEYRKDLSVQMQDRHLGATQAQYPEELQGYEELQQLSDGFNAVFECDVCDVAVANAGLEDTCDAD